MCYGCLKCKVVCSYLQGACDSLNGVVQRKEGTGHASAGTTSARPPGSRDPGRLFSVCTFIGDGADRKFHLDQ
jgi:hypothetical protein